MLPSASKSFPSPISKRYILKQDGRPSGIPDDSALVALASALRLMCVFIIQQFHHKDLFKNTCHAASPGTRAKHQYGRHRMNWYHMPLLQITKPRVDVLPFSGHRCSQRRAESQLRYRARQFPFLTHTLSFCNCWHGTFMYLPASSPPFMPLHRSVNSFSEVKHCTCFWLKS